VRAEGEKAARGELQAPTSWNLHLAPNQPDALIAQLKKREGVEEIKPFTLNGDPEEEKLLLCSSPRISSWNQNGKRLKIRRLSQN